MITITWLYKHHTRAVFVLQWTIEAGDWNQEWAE